ncbi:protein-glutamate methylesterase/protein-glutamine glutaminase [Shewanella youngdeokensis]|uniref:Protein-glutamate methylesterase/protein-glutamine glutaminase n=1 Tax=Shewanella youngdeokensis TaxID=2999068 RepID=A0ABZ0K398_9GAMM|nr:chemotaxis response regulator protein-glutamate methylesterase [Shewanella sp. DAU334]
MGIKVLVVDDSSFFRRRVSEIVNQDSSLEVVGTANNGLEAVQLAKELNPQVITMDIEMPVMDGITAVRKIMANQPVPILMFSSLTHDGAKATFDALEAGALDFLPKRFEDIATNKDDAVALLQQRIKTLGRRRLFKPATRPKAAVTIARPAAIMPSSTERSKLSTSTLSQPTQTADRPHSRANVVARASGKKYKALLIGTSTGGPVALQKVLTQLPANYPHPIVLIQHMPAAFTPTFASRLNGLCKIEVKEAETGDQLRAGCAYLAPGGMQMMLERGGRIKVLAGKEQMNYKPSVDITFGSASKVFGGDVLAVVLTGMGADGREGARMLRAAGANIWAQDEASCVVYGMPQAVINSGIASKSIGIDYMAESILKETFNG